MTPRIVGKGLAIVKVGFGLSFQLLILVLENGYARTCYRSFSYNSPYP